jgi:hypothetical protein
VVGCFLAALRWPPFSDTATLPDTGQQVLATRRLRPWPACSLPGGGAAVRFGYARQYKSAVRGLIT